MPADTDMAVARLDADGKLDTNLGPAHAGWALAAFDQGETLTMGLALARKISALHASWCRSSRRSDARSLAPHSRVR